MDGTDNVAAESSTTESLANTGTSCSSYDGDIYQAAKVIALTCSLISLLASCLVLFFIILFKRWSFFNQRLVLYLFLATIINTITAILSSIESDKICAFAGFATHIGGWINLNAYICITVALLLKVFFTINLEKLDIPITMFIFASPFLFNWIPFINNTYGKAGPICWIKNVQEVNGTCELIVFGQALQLVLWYIPLYLTLSIMIILYVMIFVKFCFHRKQWVKFNQDVDNQRKQALTFTVTLLVFPVIYFSVNIFPFIARIHGLINPINPSPVLWLLTAISFPQQGMGVAIVFLLNVHDELKLVRFKAAANEWFHKTQIKEYAFRDDEMEPSVSAKYARS